jgi:two-component system sensor histidine kinase DegS
MSENDINNDLANEATDVEQILINEIADIRLEIGEARKMIRQSQIEVDDISRQNEKINMELQHVISIEGAPSNQTLIEKFNEAISFQQRLILMRGQHDKLRNQQNQLTRFQAIFEKLKEGLAKNQAVVEEEKAESIVSVELLINAQEIERQRLSRQIHDGPAQSLSNFIMQAEIASHLLNKDPEKAKLELENLKKSAAKTFQQVRDYIFMLRPMMLDDLGLIPTIKKYGELYSERMNAEISVITTGSEQRYESFVEVMVFRAVQMLLENAIVDGKANTAKIQIDANENQIRMIVDDNRKFTDMGKLREDINQKVKTVKDRVEMMGGSMEVSPVVGEGVNILMNLPILTREM